MVVIRGAGGCDPWDSHPGRQSGICRINICQAGWIVLTFRIAAAEGSGEPGQALLFPTCPGDVRGAQNGRSCIFRHGFQ